jgi:hypothetical protein
VYSACLFCKAKLGSNDAVEHFPLGKRLAFDAAKGRLWVVCGKCSRWNLTPLEERWEAVEECERLFGGTRLRSSTEHIGLLRLPSGLDLVRVGRPQRPEFAAWRYGDRFRSRHTRAALLGAGIAANSAALVGAGTLATVAAGPVAMILTGALYSPFFFRLRRVVTRMETPDGEVHLVRGTDADEARLMPSSEPQGWRLVVPHASGLTELRGKTALRAAGPIFANLNWGGGSQKQVQTAVAELERVNDPAKLFATAVDRLGGRVIARAVEAERYVIRYLPTEMILALEMAANDEIERQAIEGELRLLEEAWREAEEIAAIADTLLLPSAVEQFIAKHKPKSPSAEPHV